SPLDILPDHSRFVSLARRKADEVGLAYLRRADRASQTINVNLSAGIPRQQRRCHIPGKNERSDQRWYPSAALIGCAVIRTSLPSRRILPIRTVRTFSRLPTAHIDVLTLKRKRKSACHYMKLLDLRHGIDDFFRHSIRKKFRFRILIQTC